MSLEKFLKEVEDAYWNYKDVPKIHKLIRIINKLEAVVYDYANAHCFEEKCTRYATDCLKHCDEISDE
jgi:hypothetical protein